MGNDNVLWEKHRLYLPEMRNIAIHRCCDCKFCIYVQGKDEVRKACIVNIKAYGKLRRRVPEVLHILDILKLVGTEGLNDCLKCKPEDQSCRKFIQKA